MSEKTLIERMRELAEDHAKYEQGGGAAHLLCEAADELEKANSRHWTLIFADLECNSVQTFMVNAVDPCEAALDLERKHPWLAPSFHLVAAVMGEPKVWVKDDDRTEERGLQGWPEPR